MSGKAPRDSPPWRRYLRFWGPDVDADVDDELGFHLDMRVRDYEARGLTSDDARRAAAERFGDFQSIGGALRAHDLRRERGRQRREYMSDLMNDVRYGLRSFGRAPAFTAVALVTLALGVGATTAIFSVVNAVILRPLPYPESDRIVQVWMDNRRTGLKEDLHSFPNYADLRDQNRVFSDMAVYFTSGYNLTTGCREAECEPQRVATLFSSADLFKVLATTPVMGRAFTAEEDAPGRDGVVVISHGLWTRLFASDRNVLGRTVRLNGRERTIIGVLPPGFAFPNRDVAVWVPMALDADDKQQRSSFGFYAVARLKPGIEFDRAVTDLGAIARRLEQQYPADKDLGVYLVPLPEQVVGRTLRTSLWVMMAAVGAVLLIACANVANLMLSRAAVREREISVRVALGAARTRLIRQLLTEAVLLSVLGAALGTGLAWGGLRVLTRIAPDDIPRLDEVRIDPLALAVTLGLAIVTGLAFGLAPAVQSSRAAVGSALRESIRGGTVGRRAQRMRRTLVALQIALVVMLLTGAGLLIRSFMHLQRVDLGFRADHLLTMRFSLPRAKYQTPQAITAFHVALLERTRQVPGVQGAALVSDIFLSATPNSTIITIDGREMTAEEQNVEIPLDAVSPDYFKAMGIPLRGGRSFTAADNLDAPQVVIINESMARRFWPNEDPLGKRFRYGGGAQNTAPLMTIVGVVADMRRTGFDAPVRYETFRPNTQWVVPSLTLVARTAGDPLTMVAPIRAQFRSIDPEQPVFEIASMDQLLSSMVAQRRFSMALLGTFAALALVLGVVGVYGVTSYLVTQRTREVGVRLALGAQPAQVVGLVVRQGMGVAVIGLAAGLVGALVAGRFMTGLLYGVSPYDVATLAGVTTVIALATLAANWVPALRAAHVDPLTALRTD